MQNRSFGHGGIHPTENKLSAHKMIQILPPPARVVIPLVQHLGAATTLLVKKGDHILAGQLLAQSGGFVSAPVHSSVSGVVAAIDEATDSSGYKRTAIVVDVDGDDWDEEVDRSAEIKKDFTMEAKEIVAKIQSAGVVGLGGATFPAHVKLTIPEGKSVDYLLINGVECEPYITADHQLMLERADEIVVGIRLLQTALGARQVVIGIESNKADAIALLTKRLADENTIRVVPLQVRYPQGGEKQLIQAVTGREVPMGKLPIDVGCVVQNVATAYAVYQAVQKNCPLIERVVTITGPQVQNPGNYLVRIGTPVSALVERAGGVPTTTVRVLSGGPMMGRALTSLDVPITKGTSAILLLPAEVIDAREEENCIRCARCTSVCPMGLEPHLLANLAKLSDWERTEQEMVMNCIECGCCAYTCPAAIRLLDWIRLAKSRVAQLMRQRTQK